MSAQVELNASIANNSTDKKEVDDKAIEKEIEESETFTKREDWVNKIQLFCILAVAIAYIIYGGIKCDNSYNNPSVKFTDKSVKNYDYPSIVACINGSSLNVSADANITEQDYYIGLSSINNVCDNNKATATLPECYTLQKDSFSFDKKKRDKWQIYEDGFYDEDDTHIYCFLIIPSTISHLVGSKTDKGKTNNTYSKYSITFEIYKKGMFDADGTFNVDAPVPSFIINQYEYSMEHQSFHMDQLYSSLTDDWDYSVGDDVGASDLIHAAYLTGTSDFYAPYCSRNDLEISLSTYETYKGKISNSFNMASFGASIDTTMFDDSTYDISVCQIGLYYYPKTKAKDPKTKRYLFYQSYATEYIEYDWAALLSGIGGITGTVSGILGAIIPIILAGFAVQWLKVQINGIAPYPNFDDSYQIKLSRFLRAYLYQHGYTHSGTSTAGYKQ